MDITDLMTEDTIRFDLIDVMTNAELVELYQFDLKSTNRFLWPQISLMKRTAEALMRIRFIKAVKQGLL
jgi:hypothetical protein